MCKISIIIPIFNVDSYLNKCLKSIQNQTFRDYEVIMINDGSTDRSGEICDKFVKEDPRFQVIHKKNEGVSVARNVGIAKAKGDYLAFFDGDDFVVEECLEEIYKTAVENNADSVIYGYFLNEYSQIIETHLPRFEKEIYRNEEIVESVIPKFIGVSYSDINMWIAGKKEAFQKENTALWHQLVRRKIVIDNNIIFDRTLKVGEDTCFTTEYLSACSTCCIISKCYYHLVVRNTSTIYRYEKDPMAILEGKRALLYGRRALTDRIKMRTSHDIQSLWYGTVVMSVFQLAVRLAKPTEGMSFGKRYKQWKSYISEKETKKAIDNLNLESWTFKSLPFWMLKRKWFMLIFAGCFIIQALPYKFER